MLGPMMSKSTSVKNRVAMYFVADEYQGFVFLLVTYLIQRDSVLHCPIFV